MEETFISGLAPAAVQRVRDAGMSRSYPARSFIFHEGEPGSGVMVVESGLLRIDRTTVSGKIVLLDLAFDGSLIGELSVIDGVARSATLSTLTASSVRFIEADAFRALMQEEPVIQAAVMTRLARRLRSLSNQLMETSTKDAPARVAARLLHLVEIERTLGRMDPTEDDPVDLKLPISQEELGQWAGLSREGTVKGLATLKSTGVLQTARKRVQISRLGALRSRAE